MVLFEIHRRFTGHFLNELHVSVKFQGEKNHQCDLQKMGFLQILPPSNKQNHQKLGTHDVLLLSCGVFKERKTS